MIPSTLEEDDDDADDDECVGLDKVGVTLDDDAMVAEGESGGFDELVSIESVGGFTCDICFVMMMMMMMMLC